MQGRALDLQQGHAIFDARRSWHATEHWKGRRVTLVAYFISACLQLSVDACAKLQDLGFNVPDHETLKQAEKSHCIPHLVKLGVPSPEPHCMPASRPDISSSEPEPSGQSSNQGVPRRRLVLELCAGSAQLSRCFIEAGYDCLPVDHKQNRFHSFAKVCNLSLTEQSTWDYLEGVVRDHHVDYVHIAPPCGTCSAARQIQTAPSDPKPLRSEQYPMGLPNLTSADANRVRAANAIYIGMAAFVTFLTALKVLWSIENPGNSWLWKLPCMVPIVKLGSFYLFDACVYGGERKTLKCFLSNIKSFVHLCQRCNGGHPHKPFGKIRRPDGSTYFATKEEAAYPRALCIQIVHLVSMELGLPLPNLQPRASEEPKQSLAKQPRGRRVLPVVPEFACILEMDLDFLPQVDSKRCLLRNVGQAPAGSKLLAPSKLNLEVGSVSLVEESTSPIRFKVSIGVFHSPEEFVAKALDTVHPFDRLDVLPDVVKRKMFEALVRGPAWVQQSRATWLGWARQSADQEKAVHAELEPGVAKVLVGKRLCLLERIAGSLGWPDSGLFNELREGFSLVGSHSHTRVFERDIRPPAITLQELKKSFVFMRPALIGKVASSRPSELDRELWQKTMEEVQEGSLVGPLSEAQASDRHGDVWVPVRRFPVVQSSAGKRKLRPWTILRSAKSIWLLGPRTKWICEPSTNSSPRVGSGLAQFLHQDCSRSSCRTVRPFKAWCTKDGQVRGILFQ